MNLLVAVSKREENLADVIILIYSPAHKNIEIHWLTWYSSL